MKKNTQFTQISSVEKMGFIPRSILRTFDRFRLQLWPGSENLVIQEFKISRYQFLVSFKSLFVLFFIPLFFNVFGKQFVFKPIIEYYWNTHQESIFLNISQEKRAFQKIENFEEKLYFEALLMMPPIGNDSPTDEFSLNQQLVETLQFSDATVVDQTVDPSLRAQNREAPNKNAESVSIVEGAEGLLPSSGRESAIETQSAGNAISSDSPSIYTPALKKARKVEYFESQIQQKYLELAIEYNDESIDALANLVTDFFTILCLFCLSILMKPQLIILKSFLTEFLYSFGDTTKSFLLLFITDLFVGFHSPHGWEVFLEAFMHHFGFAENEDFVFLFVATFPVLLDTVIKYWIFRYLNKLSPSTVATYHTMIE